MCASVADVFSVAGQEKWRTTYAHGGDRIHTTPSAGGTATTVINDARGNTTQLRQYHGPTPTGTYDATNYTYTPRGELKTVVNQAGETWTYNYDDRGHKIESTDPDTGATKYDYDILGRLKSTEDARNAVISHVYDDLDRLKSTHAGGTPTADNKISESYWDNYHKGQLAGTRSYDGDLTLTYVINLRDELYRPIRETYTLSGTGAGALAGSYQFNQSYNLEGAVASAGFPTAGGLSGESVIREYDGNGRLQRMHGDKNYADRISYYPTGLLAQVGLLAGATELFQSFHYEKGSSRLTKSIVEPLTSGSIVNTHYSHDPAGNITAIIDEPAATGGQRDAQCFDYDHLRRLTKAWTTAAAGTTVTACDGGPEVTGTAGPGAYWHDYTFHTNGNRATLVAHPTGTAGSPDEKTTSEYTYYPDTPDPGGPHSVKDVIDYVNSAETSRRSYTYDNAGNTLTRPGADGQNQTLAWDPEGRLDTLTEAGQTTRFEYDADGNRYIRREPDGATTLYLPGMELHQPAGSTSATATRYYTLPGGVTYVRTPAGGQYQTSDHHGTATTALDPDTGQAVHRRFDPYGNTRGLPPLQDQWAGTKGFVDGTQDPTGLTHLGAREYDPTTGRFVSIDPLIDHSDPQQMNGYTYANNNPITFTDPDGLAVFECGGASSCTGNGGLGDVVSHSNTSNKPYAPIYDTAPGRSEEREIQAWAESVIFHGKHGDVSLSRYTHLAKGKSFASLSTEDQLDMAVRAACYTLGRDSKACKAAVAARDAFEGADLPWWYPLAVVGGVALFAAGVDIGAINGCAGGDPMSCAGAIPMLGRLATISAAGKVAKGIAKKGCDNSFIPGTRVLMADGSYKPIEEVKIGDKVIATDPETGKTTAKPVIALIVGEGFKTLVRITIDTDGDQGEATGIVVATGNHPFWVNDQGEWIEADELEIGNLLRTPDGDLLPVNDVRDYPAYQTVHNLTIEGIHTYYVLVGDVSVLAHNTGEKCRRNGHLAGGTHPKTGVPFDKDGFPDFSAWRHPDVPDVWITPSGNRATDFARANAAAGLERTPAGYTWHHHQKYGRMQLVETSVHRATGHTGGYSVWD